MRSVVRKVRFLLAATAAAGLCVLVGLFLLPSGDDGVEETPGVVSIEEGDLLYAYHVVTGTESLFDQRADPRCLRNLLPERGETGSRLRSRLERRLGLGSLEELRRERRREIAILESLGYL